MTETHDLMFMSREIDIEQCQMFTKIYICIKLCTKIVGLTAHIQKIHDQFIQHFTENLFRNIAQNRITQQRNFARNEVCECLRKVLFFSSKIVAQRKQKFALSFAKIAQKSCEWKS